MYYVYLLLSEREEKYIGFTQDLEKRLKKHNSGESKYTRGRTWRLVYYEAYASRSDAMKREKRLKQDGRSRYALMKRVEDSIASVV